MIKLFCENSKRLLDDPHLCKKAPYKMFDRVLNIPLDNAFYPEKYFYSQKISVLENS